MIQSIKLISRVQKVLERDPKWRIVADDPNFPKTAKWSRGSPKSTYLRVQVLCDRVVGTSVRRLDLLMWRRVWNTDGNVKITLQYDGSDKKNALI